MNFLGIDPGKKGGVGLLSPAGSPVVWDAPDGVADMAQLIGWIQEEHGPVGLCAIEKVHAMPKQGVRSVFTFGENYGAWQGVLAALHVPYITPTPQQWMRGLVDKKAGKSANVATAKRMFPEVNFHGPRGGARDGRADALLIAWYAKQQGDRGLM